MQYKKYQMLLCSFILFNFASLSSYALDNSTEAIQKRIQPVGQVNISTNKATTPESKSAGNNPAKKADGKAIFENVCQACHGTGVNGAPIIGDAAAWKPRIAKGINTLFAHATKGFNAMPAKGGCSTCSDADIKAAIQYMTEQSKS